MIGREFNKKKAFLTIQKTVNSHHLQRKK